MQDAFTDEQLLAYLDELLPAEQMAAVEQELRHAEGLRRRLSALIRRRDQGQHSVGEIWRRHRLSCPSRRELGQWLLDRLDADLAGYIEFHLRTVACRYCTANLADLERAMEPDPATQQRRRKFFQSSAGYLRTGKSR